MQNSAVVLAVEVSQSVSPPGMTYLVVLATELYSPTNIKASADVKGLAVWFLHMIAFVEQTAQISNKKTAREILEVMIVDCLKSQKQSAEFSDFSHARGKEMMH
jgi:hypothetical protein